MAKMYRHVHMYFYVYTFMHIGPSLEASTDTGMLIFLCTLFGAVWLLATCRCGRLVFWQQILSRG